MLEEDLSINLLKKKQPRWSTIKQSAIKQGIPVQLTLEQRGFRDADNLQSQRSLYNVSSPQHMPIPTIAFCEKQCKASLYWVFCFVTWAMGTLVPTSSFFMPLWTSWIFRIKCCQIPKSSPTDSILGCSELKVEKQSWKHQNVIATKNRECKRLILEGCLKF